MSYAKNIPITIQKQDPESEKWSDEFKLHARITRTKGSEYLKTGAVQSQYERVFEVMYFPALKDVEFNTGIYRIVYNNTFFNITDYDDFMDEHKNVKLVGVSYG